MEKFQFMFVRHGQTELNVQKRATGWFDIPLNETGREQAKEVGKTIVQLPPEYLPDIIIHSGLQRAAETAAIIRRGLTDKGHPTRLEQIDDLKERNAGTWEGELWDEVAPGETLTRNELRVRGIFPPDAEDDPAFIQRIKRGIAHGMDANHFGSGRRLFVWHGGVERILRRIYAVGGADQWPPNAKVHILFEQGDGKFRVYSP